MSLSATRLQPSPTAGPLTAATIGTRQRAMPRTRSRPCAMVFARSSASRLSSARYSKSPPAENARPLPVSTAARASRSSLSRGQSRASPVCSGSLTALSASGRLSVMIRSGPSATTPISSGRSYMSGGSQSENARGDDVLLDLRGAAHDRLRPAVEVGAEQLGVAGAALGQRRVPDSLLGPGHQQLVERSLGAVRHPVEPLRQP